MHFHHQLIARWPYLLQERLDESEYHEQVLKLRDELCEDDALQAFMLKYLNQVRQMNFLQEERRKVK